MFAFKSLGADQVIDYPQDDFTENGKILEQIAEAHRYVQNGHKKGNVVINVR